MTRNEMKIRRAKREIMLAEILLEEIKDNRESVWTKTVFKKFKGNAAFSQMGHFTKLLGQLPLNLTKKGNGKHVVYEILIDNACISFVARKLERNVAAIAALQSEDFPHGRNRLFPAEFHQLIESIPDFTPMGDPVFHLTKAPRF